MTNVEPIRKITEYPSYDVRIANESVGRPVRLKLPISKLTLIGITGAGVAVGNGVRV
jgi:hypothetical protein